MSRWCSGSPGCGADFSSSPLNTHTRASTPGSSQLGPGRSRSAVYVPVRVRAGERPSRPAPPRPSPGLGHLPGKLVADCCPRVVPGRGHEIGPWKLRRGLVSPGSGRESGTQTGTPARTETATPSDSGTERRTSAGREMEASGGTGTGAGGGTETPARTGTGAGTIALLNKDFGKTPAKAGRGTDLSGRPGTQPRPPGPRLGKPRGHRPTGRRTSGAADREGEVGLRGALRPRRP